MDGINLKNAVSPQHNVRSNFDLSFSRKWDCAFGDLQPALVLPVIPGDNIACSYAFIGRMAPFISQVFARYYIRTSFYYVPNRVVWHNFDKFMVGGFDGKQTFVSPYFTLAQLYRHTIGSVANSQWERALYHNIFEALDIPPALIEYGHPQSPHNGMKINALPFGALLRVLYDYKVGTSTPLSEVQQNLLDSEIFHDGPAFDMFAELYNSFTVGSPTDVGSDNYPMNASFPKDLYDLDYFTSSRSNTQLGPVMTIPLQLVNTDANGVDTFRIINNAQSDGTTSPALIRTAGSNRLQLRVSANDSANYNIVVNGEVFNNTATINDFYSAARIQEFLTLMGFSGFLPADAIAAEYGVRNNDSRLQKAQFLGSEVHQWHVGEVYSNAVSNPDMQASDTNLIAGAGTAVAKAENTGRGFHISQVPEHGYIIGLVSVIPEASYHEGLPKHLRLTDRFEYPHPLFAQLGMDSVKYSEIFVPPFSPDTPNLFNPDAEFAYKDRYADYKVGVNRVNGQFRQQLAFMSSGRQFGTLDGLEVLHRPVFNEDFLRVNPMLNHLNRTFNVTSTYPYDNPILLNFDFNVRANRELPYYGLPKF